jgi:hypothetical protein
MTNNTLLKETLNLIIDFLADEETDFFAIDLNRMSEYIKDWYDNTEITRSTMLAAVVLGVNGFNPSLDWDDYENLEKYYFPEAVAEREEKEYLEGLAKEAFDNFFHISEIEAALHDFDFLK